MNISLKQTRDDIINHAGLAIINNLIPDTPLFKSDFMIENITRSDFIPFGIILKAECFKQCMALTNYEDIRCLNTNNLFHELLGTNISPETLRQKLNFISKQEKIYDYIDLAVAKFLKTKSIKREIYGNKEYYVLDIDVSPFCNPKVQKEGVSWTYKGFEGFSPIFSYIGSYGLAFDLRPGSQHSEDGAIEFLDRSLKILEKIGINPSDILLRVDSGHDDSKFIEFSQEKGINYIIARNRRRENNLEYIRYVKMYAQPITFQDEPNIRHYRLIIDEKKPSKYKNKNVQCIYDVSEKINNDLGEEIEYITDPRNQLFGNEPNIEYEITSYWTNIKILNEDGNECDDHTRFVNECVDIYRQHATSEQFHSEIKTDMRMELLPSKYFKTNRLILGLSVIAYNILRYISIECAKNDKRFQHNKVEYTERSRIFTVLTKLINIPCKLVRHSRRIVLKFGRNFQFFNIFKLIFNTV